jgi:DNA-binding NtrC family response regulator/PAS domain-containing protein
MAKPPHDKSSKVPSHIIPLSVTLEGFPLGILILDGEGIMLGANSYMADLLGLGSGGASSVVGRHVSEIMPQGAHTLSDLLGSGEGNMCLRLPEVDGIYFVAIPLQSAGGGLSLTAGNLNTLGAYFGAIPEERHSNYLFAKVVGPFPEGLMVCDSRGTVVYANERAAQIMGVGREEFEGRKVACLAGRIVSGEWLILDILTSGRPVAGFVSCPYGEKAVFLSGFPVHGPNGELSQAVFTLRSLASPASGEAAAMHDRELAASFRKSITGSDFRPTPGHEFTAKSPVMRKAIEHAGRIARSGALEVLVLGETGTGRGAMARFVHDSSPRSGNPFVRVNCACRVAHEIEKEIFGAEAGITVIAGLFEAASKGTICLEEADALPHDVQRRIASCITAGEYRRSGGSQLVKTEAAVIVTASGDPQTFAERGGLVPELRQALSSSLVAVPPLRSRREDILEIARLEVSAQNARYGLRRYIDAYAADTLSAHGFPGNVRELKSAVHKAVIFSATPNIGPFLSRMFNPYKAFHALSDSSRDATCDTEDKLPTLQMVRKSSFTEVMNSMEKRLLDEAVRNCKSTREMATTLGISQAGVSRKLKKFSLDAPGKFYRK